MRHAVLPATYSVLCFMLHAGMLAMHWFTACPRPYVTCPVDLRAALQPWHGRTGTTDAG